jgi:hypothetical protein
MATSARSAADWYFQDDGDGLVDSAVASLGQPTPPLMAILAEPDTISVLPSLNNTFPPPPTPWAHVPEIDSWTCNTNDLHPSAAATARRPVMLPMGTARGGVLLVNLEEVSPLTISGAHTSAVTAVLRAWVMNLLLAPQRVVAAAAAATSQLGEVGSDRFITAPNATALRQRLTSLNVDADVVVLDDADPRSVELFPTTPCVITTAPREGIWDFRVTDRSATLANDTRNLSLPLDAITAVDDDRWEQLVASLLAAPAPSPAYSPPANGHRPLAASPTPSATDDLDDDQLSPHIWVRILGEPVITPPDGRIIDDPGRSRVWTSVIAYLATVGRDGATRDELRDCWGSASTVSDQSIRQTVSRIRGFLGTAPDGRPLLPELGRGGRRGDFEPPQAHRLDPLVLSDWERWQQLIGQSPTTASDDALAEALALVRGPAFDVPPNTAARYEWAKFLADEITDAASDAALQLATRRFDRGDHAGTVSAAMAGLKANPQRQDLWRLTLKATTDKVALATLSNQLRTTIPSSDIEAATRRLLT